jgi:hypothetical protein
LAIEASGLASVALAVGVVPISAAVPVSDAAKVPAPGFVVSRLCSDGRAEVPEVVGVIGVEAVGVVVVAVGVAVS